MLLLAAILALAAFFTRGLWLPEPPDLCFVGGAGQSLDEVILTGSVPTDVLFAFDQSGSMEDMISGAKSDGSSLMNALGRRRGTQRFGLVGFSDYGEFPYLLYESLTEDRDKINNAILGLRLAHGGDRPESYGRVMYESYTDDSIGWNKDAQKYLVVFGDSFPHDPDPGRDEVLNTADDLIFEDVLQEMAENGIGLIFVAHPSISNNNALIDDWGDWTGRTGGSLIRCRTTTDS